MLNHPTLEKLHELNLHGMLAALREQINMPECETLGFEERLGLLVDREATDRENRRLTARLKRAKLRQNAAIEEIDYRHPRGLDKAAVLALASCKWIRKHQNCIITGPTGAGKSYLACALAQKACREDFRALYCEPPCSSTISPQPEPMGGTAKSSPPMQCAVPVQRELDNCRIS